MSRRHAEICKVISRIKAFGLVVIALCLGTTAGNCAGLIDKTISISPSHPIESWTVTLPPNVTAKAAIVMETPTGWQLVGQPTIHITGPSTTLWTRIGTASEYQFSVTNTGNATHSTTVRVRCVWRRTSVVGGGGPGDGGPGGGGPGVGPTDIHGLASALAYFLYGEQLVWEFLPTTYAAVPQWINWKVRLFDSLGDNVSVQWNQMCPINVTPTEAMAHWKVGPDLGPCKTGPVTTSSWAGHVKSFKPSSGQLQVTLTRSGTQMQKTSPVTLSFFSVDLRATDLDGIVVEEDDATPGAFVHWNIDNDDKSDNTVGGTANKHPGGDYLQVGTAAVTGEDDLKQLVMSFGTDVNVGTIALNISNNKAKLWKSPTKGSANLVLAGPGEKTWDLANPQQKAELLALSSSLWVEGAAEGPTQIKLAYRNTAGNEINADQVNYTFIAANCGRQPKTVPDNPEIVGERGYYSGHFPSLINCEWSITGEKSNMKNCLGFAVGKNQTIWGSTASNPAYYPTGVDIIRNNSDNMTFAIIKAYLVDGIASDGEGVGDGGYVYLGDLGQNEVTPEN